MFFSDSFLPVLPDQSLAGRAPISLSLAICSDYSSPHDILLPFTLLFFVFFSVSLVLLLDTLDEPVPFPSLFFRFLSSSRFSSSFSLRFPLTHTIHSLRVFPAPSLLMISTVPTFLPALCSAILVYSYIPVFLYRPDVVGLFFFLLYFYKYRSILHHDYDSSIIQVLYDLLLFFLYIAPLTICFDIPSLFPPLPYLFVRCSYVVFLLPVVL